MTLAFHLGFLGNAPPSSAGPCYVPSSSSDLVLDDLRRLSVVSDRASVCLAAGMERLCSAESPRESAIKNIFSLELHRFNLI
ncbi:unnamed protein product [Musa acuminata subsp. burmannicoides]